MTKFHVTLKSLTNSSERVILAETTTKEQAEQMRKNWRKVLGNKNWTIDRRPGLDTLDHLGLTVEHTQ